VKESVHVNWHSGSYGEKKTTQLCMSSREGKARRETEEGGGGSKVTRIKDQGKNSLLKRISLSGGGRINKRGEEPRKDQLSPASLMAGQKLLLPTQAQE